MDKQSRFFIDGVPVAAGARQIRFAGWGDMWSTGTMSGGNYSTPGLDGEVWRRKRRDAGLITCRFHVFGDHPDPRRAAAIANTEWQTVLRMFPRRRPVVVTRVQDVLIDGVIVEQRQDALAELVDSITPAFLATSFRTGELTLKILDGCWHTDGEPRAYTLTSGVPTFIPVSGTTDTHRIAVTFSGASAGQRLTNESASVWMQIAADTTVFPMVWNVEKFTGTQNGAFALGGSTSGGDEYAMILDPDLGQNRLILTGGGSAKISWTDAWL
jgi:hypothetical protein